MKETRAINDLWYEVTAKELTLINKTESRLKAYKMADYFKNLGYKNIKIAKITQTTIAETIEENY